MVWLNGHWSHRVHGHPRVSIRTFSIDKPRTQWTKKSKSFIEASKSSWLGERIYFCDTGQPPPRWWWRLTVVVVVVVVPFHSMASSMFIWLHEPRVAKKVVCPKERKKKRWTACTATIEDAVKPVRLDTDCAQTYWVRPEIERVARGHSNQNWVESNKHDVCPLGQAKWPASNLFLFSIKQSGRTKLEPLWSSCKSSTHTNNIH